jgi:diguanylate cyclase (GGDEF)-like protein/PAS domain S-box-containing protein
MSPPSQCPGAIAAGLGDWIESLPQLLDASRCIAIGRWGAGGEPIYLSAGMRALLGGETPDRPRCDYLANPTYPQLVAMSQERAEGEVFRGWVTLGDGQRAIQSMRAVVYRRDAELLMLAEHDAAELARLQRELSETNQQINNLHRDLLRRNARLAETLVEAERQLQSLRDSEQRLRLVVEHIADPVIVTDTDARIRSINPAFTRVTGYTAEEIIGQTPKRLASGRHPPSFYAAMRATLASTGEWRGTIWNRRKDGAAYVQRLNISTLHDSHGETLFVAVYNDIGQEVRALERAQFLAEHDVLTGLANRVLLQDRLSEALRDARERQHLVGVLMIDLDRFKPINDTYGHAVGDSVLQIVARRLERCVRRTDSVARLGGDEFVVVLRDLPSPAPAKQAVQTIQKRLTAPLRLKALRLAIDASIGYALGPVDAEDTAALIARADAAMYAVKHERRAHQG